jgi:hypothetical protein
LNYKGFIDLLKTIEGGRVSVSSVAGDIVELDGDTRDISVHADTLKRLGVSMSPIRRLLGLRSSFKLPRRLNEAGWRLTLLFNGEPILTAGRGVSAITDHVHISLKHVLDLV